MAIFETLSIIFKADTGQLKKEVDDVKKKTQEYTAISKDSEEQTKKTDNEFVALSKTLAAVATTYFGAASIIGGFKSSLAKTTDLSQLSKQLDVDIETLDAWGRAVENAGGSSASFQSSLLALSETFNSSGEVALAYLPKLAEKFQNLTATQAQIYGKRLGLNPDVVTFIRQGPKAVEAVQQQKAIGVTSQEDANRAQKYNEATGKLADSFDNLKRAILEDALPEIIKLVDVLTAIVQFFTLNKESTTGRPAYATPSWKEILGGSVAVKVKPLPSNETSKTTTPSNIPVEGQVPLPPISGFNDVYETPAAYRELPYIPPVIPQVTNSQARNLYVGSVNVNTTAQDTKAVADEVIVAFDKKSQFLNQLQQTNANFDNGVYV